ncbi:NAD(P)H-binding protein [Bizionia saleffrena]|uniref:NAD(P)H-binding protein n=1 Tax=Bizionia saleffrena TaxID=291189 RepID=A0A8H2LDR7_9FLAO|nr:NAD(P)H-binding protein [Bizionia saleffrena]TYB76698.1 NAD(P)H-binding protein [Bizionia saleffrena]
MKKTAIILGASGLTGSYLLEKIIKDGAFNKIKLFSRSKIEGLPTYVEQYIGDLLKLEDFKADFTADVVFCCIGTTASKTPDKALYKAIDYGIPVAAAKLCKSNNIPAFMVISALGADKNSSVFYNKTKGEMEAVVITQNLRQTYIFRPSLIDGPRNEKRFLENIGLFILKAIQPLFIGNLKKYKIIHAERIAQALLNTSKHSNIGVTIIPPQTIQELANK